MKHHTTSATKASQKRATKPAAKAKPDRLDAAREALFAANHAAEPRSPATDITGALYELTEGYETGDTEAGRANRAAAAEVIAEAVAALAKLTEKRKGAYERLLGEDEVLEAVQGDIIGAMRAAEATEPNMGQVEAMNALTMLDGVRETIREVIGSMFKYEDDAAHAAILARCAAREVST